MRRAIAGGACGGGGREKVGTAAAAWMGDLLAEDTAKISDDGMWDDIYWSACNMRHTCPAVGTSAYVITTVLRHSQNRRPGSGRASRPLAAAFALAHGGAHWAIEQSDGHTWGPQCYRLAPLLGCSTRSLSHLV